MKIIHAQTSERRKFTTVRLPGAVVALTAAASGFGGVLNVHHFGPIERLDVTAVALDVLRPVWFLVVVTVLAAASAIRHRTVVTSLPWTPRRGDLLAATGLVAAGFRALICVVAIATSVAAGVVTSVIEDIPFGNSPAEEWAGLLAGMVAGALL
jgi:hypothetical protein